MAASTLAGKVLNGIVDPQGITLTSEQASNLVTPLFFIYLPKDDAHFNHEKGVVQ